MSASGSGWAQQVCDTSTHELSSPSSRFIDHSDGTVTDKRSQLMWMRCAAGQSWAGNTCTGESRVQVWAAAQAYADQVNRAGTYFFNDWRVPSLRELATVTERQCRNPRINLDVFPRAAAAFHWTASSRPGAGNEGAAFVLSLGEHGIDHVDKTQAHHVRLVRSAP